MAENEIEKKVIELVENASSPEGARHLISSLFPKTESFVRTYVQDYQPNLTDKHRSHRISDSNFAHLYFELSNAREIWNFSELNDLYTPTILLTRCKAQSKK